MDPFLPHQRGPRRHGPAEDKPFPPREGNRIEGLLLAEEMYPALERAVLGAERLVYLAFRIFDPDTRLRSPEARAEGLTDWTSLIRHVLLRGVTVRLMLSDFEPTVAHDLHGGSWSSFRTLRAMADALPRPAWDRFEIIVSQHPGEMGWATRQLLRLPIGRLTRGILKTLSSDVDAFDRMIEVRPGLWRHHRLAADRPVFRRGPTFRLWPATHHHKFAVIDEKVAIVGGLDVDERRWETRRYAQPAHQSWHDISVRLTGPAVTDVSCHFSRLWNSELPRYKEITRFWMTGAERRLAIDPLDEITDPPSVPEPVSEGTAKVQLLRTLSRRSRHPFAIGPRAYIRELMQAHRTLIFSARKLLYIEAQFFRRRRVARWVAEAAKRNPQLEIIILLPQAPEEVAFDGQLRNPAHRHGEWLQARALGWLMERLPERVGLFSLARKPPLTPEEEQFAATGGAAFGSGIIYVHSKLLIADDRYGLCSSANINRRSFGWDSEFGLLWEDEEGTGRLRRRLWSHILERPEADLPEPGDALHQWGAQALANLGREPGERQGFVVPYRLSRVRQFGRPAWFVPDDLV